MPFNPTPIPHKKVPFPYKNSTPPLFITYNSAFR